MQPEKKREGLLRFLATGLITHSVQDTLSQLGDRSKYIGLSDIGKALDCMRSAVADKAGIAGKTSLDITQNTSSKDIESLLRKQLTLQRGHWQEHGIEKALLATQVKFIPQLEVSIEHNGIPVKAHLDFTIVRDDPHPAIRILELKSNEHIPEHLYASYEAQLYGQIGMLYENWNKPCFSTPSADVDKGCVDMTFPELSKQLFGIILPDDPAQVDIEAWVVSVSMSEIKPFGPYRYDKGVLQTCYKIAEQLWSNKESLSAGTLALNDISYATGFHPLCDFCAVNNDCQKFTETLVHDDEYNLQLDELADLKEQEKVITKRKKHLEKVIKTRFQQSIGTDDGWLSTGSYRFKVTQIPGRKTINHNRLSEFVGENVEDVIHQCQESGKPYSRLYVSRINQ